MDRSTLYNIFSKAYNHENWIKILQTTFGVKQLYAQQKPILLPNNEQATGAFELGNFTTSDDRIIGLYRVDVKSDVWLERNKVTLRGLLRNIYKYDVDGAIVVFVQEDKWRLSFISEIKAIDDEGQIVEMATESKRFTYLLGQDEKVRTPSDRLSKLSGKSIAIQDILNAFSVEALNEEFYKIVQAFFYELVGGTISKGKKEDNYQGILELPNINIQEKQVYKEFAVRLIGRTVFCWFLKMKKSNDGKALLPEHLLSSKAVKNNGNYYHSILERLFFQTLNTPMEERVSNLPEGAEIIPFLNGGLFEPGSQDFYKANIHTGLNEHTSTLNINDDWFAKFFFELEKYNFTIDENSAIEVEVSVDPEMLGRIFENLLAEIDPASGETARKATGSFYTPREIVDYMATESLVQYIHNKTSIESDKLRPIFKMLEIKDPDFSVYEKEQILDALDTVKILDPACGSGAFPLGILQKIVQALQKLDVDAEWWKKRQIDRIKNPTVKKILREKLASSGVEYARKIGVVQNSLYGVDIQPVAAEISKLRCFLSLVVDENIDESKPNRGIEPLPNLEFKFVTADTLMKLTEDQTQRTMFDSFEELQELEDLRNEYIQSSGSSKKSIKDKFLKVQFRIAKDQSSLFADKESRAYKLGNWDPFGSNKSAWFDPKWMFGTEKFDLVIGNPPYIQLSKAEGVSIDYRNYLKNEYKTSGGRLNTFIFFIHKGLTMLNPKGILTYIIPNTILTQDYYSYSREQILKNYSLKKVVNYVNMPFANAVVENVTLLIENSESAGPYDILSFKDDLKNIELTASKSSSDFLSNKNFSFNFNSNQLIEMIENDHASKVDDYCYVNQAIALKGAKSLSLKDSNPEGSYYKLLDGRNIKKYSVAWDNVYLDYNLERIHSCKRKDIFESSEKLMFRRVSSNLVFAYDNQQYYALNTIVVLNSKSNKTNLKYLLAVLNSRLVNYYYSLRYKSTKKVFSEIQARSVKEIPIPNVEPTIQKGIVILVDYLLHINSNTTMINRHVTNNHIIQLFEEVIDAMVMELYFKRDFVNAGIEFIKYIGRDFEDIQGKQEQEQIEIIHKSYQKLREKDNEIRNNLKLMDIKLADIVMPIKAGK